jgi:hypothetical protein
MTEFGDWLQNNGIDLARLAIDCVILVIVARFSRSLLRTLRASQEQLGALLRLSLSDGGEQASSLHGASEQAFPDSIPAPVFSPERAFAPMAPAPAYQSSSILGPINGSNGAGPNSGSSWGSAERRDFSERERSLGGRAMDEPMTEAAVALAEPPEPTPWVAAPMNSATEAGGNGGGIAESGRSMVQWLNSPAPKRTKKRGNPLRSAMRWLQTPAGR